MSHDHTREFFAVRAATWDDKFPDDEPAFAMAVSALGLPSGGTALDVGCGTGRALPLLQASVGASGRVIGVDLTPEMLAVAAAKGRGAANSRSAGPELVVADARRLPLGDAMFDGVLAAGLLTHLPDPAAGLAELARVTRPGGRLALFHPIGRAALAARRGHALRPDDIRAEPNLRPALQRTGWTLLSCDDADTLYLAVARRV